MSSEIAIKVENLSKCYMIYDQPRERLKQFVLPRLQRLAGFSPKQYYREFWALRDVSFEVRRGETVGIIGRNGSGKSTLLQMICGTLSPTGGNIITHGRIAALLELGSGFNIDFTGRENVFINAALLGLNFAEIESRFQEIADFADIGDFIDQPVKTYSSGMLVRLAFAVQAQISPDILIVDEALAVGDAKFQAKCFERLNQLKASGTSILLVTHSSDQIVAHCNRAILLDHGLQIEVGSPRRITNRYLDLLFGKEKSNSEYGINEPYDNSQNANNISNEFLLSEDASKYEMRPLYNKHEYRWGDSFAEILDFLFSVDGEFYPAYLKSGQEINLNISIKFKKEIIRPILGFTLKTKEGIIVYGSNTETLEFKEFSDLGLCNSVVKVNLKIKCCLGPGDYFISLGIASMDKGVIIPHDRRYDSIHFTVTHIDSFFGIADLGLEISSGEL